MKRLRHAVLAALFLVSWTPTAGAECAWVLWSNRGTVDPTLPLAFATVEGSVLNWQPISGRYGEGV